MLPAGLTSHGIATTVGTRQQAESTQRSGRHRLPCVWLVRPFLSETMGDSLEAWEAASFHSRDLGSRFAKSSRLPLPLRAADTGATWTVFAARATAAGQGHGMTVKFHCSENPYCNSSCLSAGAFLFPGCVDVDESFPTSAPATSHLRRLKFSRAIVFAIQLRASC